MFSTFHGLSNYTNLVTQHDLYICLCQQMEQMEEPILDAIYGGAVNFTDNGAEAESFKHRVDEIFVKVDKVIESSLLLFHSGR